MMFYDFTFTTVALLVSMMSHSAVVVVLGAEDECAAAAAWPSGATMTMRTVLLPPVLQHLWLGDANATGAQPSSSMVVATVYLLDLLTAVTLIYLVWNLLSQWNVWYRCQLFFEYVFTPVPTIHVEMTKAESTDDGITDDDASNNNKKKNKNRRLNEKKGYIQCYDPSTQQRLGEVIAMTATDVEAICARAKQAQRTWSRTTFRQRRQVLRTIQKYICQHVEDICRVCSRDSGKPKLDALLGEILTTCEKIRTINSEGELWLRPSSRSTGPLMMHKTAWVEYVPMGTVAPIAPWNYPFHNMMNHIISGIFAGNAVVGKVSEHTSWSSQYFSRIVRQALEEHGHDANLVATITGFGDAGAALVADPNVDKVIFTGSPGIGRKVMETASHHLKPVILELGGKDAMIILDDCQRLNLDSAIVPWLMRGCYQNCGQNCVGIERVLIYESVYDEIVKAVVDKVKALRQGIPLATCGASGDIDCGSMVMQEQLTKIQELVDDAVKKGAKVLVGGKPNTDNISGGGDGGGGQFYQPTVIVDVTPDMRIFQEEVFGPVMTIVKVADDDDALCIKYANGTDFGLGCSIYCHDQQRGLALGRQIRSGMLCVNDFGSNYLVQAMPFGGVQESGFGRFAGPEGLRALCLERSILLDKFPSLVKTTIPPPIDYPINKSKALPFGISLVQFFYNENWIEKIKGIVGLIKFA